jgi:hypothetical protein
MQQQQQQPDTAAAFDAGDDLEDLLQLLGVTVE